MREVKSFWINIIFFFWRNIYNFLFKNFSKSKIVHKYFEKNKKFFMTRPSYHELSFFDTFMCMCFFDNVNLTKYGLYVKHLDHIPLRRALIYPNIYIFFCNLKFEKEYDGLFEEFKKINSSKSHSDIVFLKKKIFIQKKTNNIYKYFIFLNYENLFFKKKISKKFLYNIFFDKYLNSCKNINIINLIHTIWISKNLFKYNSLFKLFLKKGIVDFDYISSLLNKELNSKYKFTSADIYLSRTSNLQSNFEKISYFRDYLSDFDEKVLKTSTRICEEEKKKQKKTWEEEIKEKIEKNTGKPAYERNSFRITFFEKLMDYKAFFNKKFDKNVWNYWNRHFLMYFYKNIYEFPAAFLKKNYQNKINEYKILFKPTDVSKEFLKKKNIFSEKFSPSVFFLRKNKIFNKGRYSRNRQLYRTGVYWCLWLNIISVYGLYLYFYKFTFNFGYMYLPLLVFILSIFGSRIVRYRFYNFKIIVNEILHFINYLFPLYLLLQRARTSVYLYYKYIFKNFFKKNLFLIVSFKKFFFRNK